MLNSYFYTFLLSTLVLVTYDCLSLAPRRCGLLPPVGSRRACGRGVFVLLSVVWPWMVALLDSVVEI